jgi:hypothetical protein
MLTVEQKATILARAGSDVPPFPRPESTHADALQGPGSETLSEAHDAQARQAGAVARWNQEVEVLFSYYLAARAAKSLRDAESVKQMAMLRRATARLP